MSTSTLNPRPSWSAMAHAQVRMITLLQKRDFLALGGLLAVLLGLVVWAHMRMSPENVGEGTLPIFPGLAIPFAILGALWPLGVWRADTPERRGYFWSLPVDRRPHTLLRVGIGWSVLLSVCLAVMALAVAALAPAVIRFETLHLDLARPWVPLATATLAYVVVSVFAVLFESPVRWLAWTWLAVLAVFIVTEATDLDALSERVETVVQSFLVALGGPQTARGNAIGLWARYYVGWLALGSAGLVAAALRHQDER